MCVNSNSFTIAWSDWIPPTGFDHDGYQVDVYPYSRPSGFGLKETVKVGRLDNND